MAVSKKRIEEYNKSFYSTVSRLKNRKSGFTVEDVTNKIGNPPSGRNSLGALMVNAASKYGLEPIA